MKNIIHKMIYKSVTIKTAITVLLLFLFLNSYSQMTTIPSGAFIVNMGVLPQTRQNAIVPYGMLYDMLSRGVPVHWVINTSKAKDGIDFSYGGTDFRGGPFIIEAQYRTTDVNTRIAYWQSRGVIGVTTTSPVTVPVYLTFSNLPNWTLDDMNGQLYLPGFHNAEIPDSAYGGDDKEGWKSPAELTCCDDIYVMPHAEPEWAEHYQLYDYITNCRGAMVTGCKAGSQFSDMWDNSTLDGDPVDHNQQTNFLCNKSGPHDDAGTYNSLLWPHDNGTPPYSYDYAGEPVMQFMGILDNATFNGAEQVYMPAAGSGGWYPTTHVGVFDPDHPDAQNSLGPAYRAAILVYGPAFAVDTFGKFMILASHRPFGDDDSPTPEQVATTRAFFNFSFLNAWELAILPTINNLPDTLSAGNPAGYTLSYTVPPHADPLWYHSEWSTDCGGTFLPNSSANPVTYIPPVTPVAVQCSIKVVIEDLCHVKSFNTVMVWVQCKIRMTPTVTQPTCHGLSNGSISMHITGDVTPFSWSWTRSNPAGGPVSGTDTIITGLSAGTYTINITGGSGCTGTFTVLVSEPPLLTASASASSISCFGGTGTVNLTAQGGTIPYSYDWADLSGTNDPEDRTGLSAGTYTVTVTDSKGCTATTSAVVSGPSGSLVLSGTQTNISCFGGSNGAIDITVTGGTSPYTYSWNGGVTIPDRNGLTAGSYTVVVTDAKGCTATQSFVITQPPLLTVNRNFINPQCHNEGSIDVIVTGGTPPYTYDWSDLNPPPAEPEDRTGLTAGTYSVIVTDANGCTGNISATLNQTAFPPCDPEDINHPN
ncbi:MAG TPA: SprB repeat-containing protein [Bacteroidales bacterium]|mgnify:CR=1 FL=1|nr:SprB repeat-containing protein [Bacteroidales bacterium]